MEAAVLACRRNLKDFAFRLGSRKCRIIWSSIRSHVSFLRDSDPVHMTNKGYNLMAKLVIDTVSTPNGDSMKRMPESETEDYPSKKRPF